MASDFTYDGVMNGQYQFRENDSGQFHFAPAHYPGVEPQLLDGDEVAVRRPNNSDVDVYSIRQQRLVRTEFRPG